MEEVVVPRLWRRAGGICIFKKKDFVDFGQFRSACLLSVEDKNFSIVVAQKLLSHRHLSAESCNTRLFWMLRAKNLPLNSISKEETCIRYS